MCKQIEKKKSYTTPKNIQFGEWRLVKNIPQLPIPILTWEPNQEEIIIDFKSLVEKNIEYKKHLRVIRVLKKLVKANMIIKHILNLGINLIIGKLLVFAPAV